MLRKEFSRSKHSVESKVELVRQRMFHEISINSLPHFLSCLANFCLLLSLGF